MIEPSAVEVLPSGVSDSPSRPPIDKRLFSKWSGARVRQISWSCIDQFLGVGGMFLANIVLARFQSKEEYGMFALCYSIFTFLSGLHNAIILEPYTVQGPGRYHQQFPQYSRLMWRSNAIVVGTLGFILLLLWASLTHSAPHFASRSLLGLSLSVAFMLSGLFVRRTFYLRRRPDLAGRFSIVFFVTLALFLGFAAKSGFLNGFSTFLIVAASWIFAGLVMVREIPRFGSDQPVEELDPNHWMEHWRYARWVLATAFVFQLTTQGYYWLVAGFLSIKEVAGLRAIYILVTPVDQIIGAVTLLVLPVMSFRYASKRHPELISLWKKYGAAILLLTASYSAIVWLAAKPLLHSVYGGKFDDLSGSLAILVLLSIVMGLGNVANVALKSIEKPDSVFYAYLVSGATTFVVGIPLVMHFGLRGAVYGMLLSGATYTCAMLMTLTSAARLRLQGRRLFDSIVEDQATAL